MSEIFQQQCITINWIKDDCMIVLGNAGVIYSTIIDSQIAHEHGIRFMETSAKSNINIERAISELAEAILDKAAGREADADLARIAVERRPSRAPPARACCS